MPALFSQAATSVPSRSQARFQYPPPGQITIAAPVFFSGAGRNTVMVGLVTLVIHCASLVGESDGSRTLSGPNLPKSPGTLSGQTGSTSGVSAALPADESKIQPARMSQDVVRVKSRSRFMERALSRGLRAT